MILTNYKTCGDVVIKMTDAIPTVNNVVPLIPVVPPSPRGTGVSASPSTRRTPTLLRGPITPTAPMGAPSTISQMTPTLRMPNIAITRPLTSPVTIHRSASNVSSAITIPSKIGDFGSLSRDSTQRSPVNITGRTETTSTGNRSASGIKDSAVDRTQFDLVAGIVRIPTSPPRVAPPTVTTAPTALSVINTAVNSEIATNAAVVTPPPDPLIKRENLVPIANRPLSPRDTTTITLHGVPLDRNTITPIAIDTDSDDDDDDDVVTTDRPEIIANITGRAPVNIPTAEETSTADTTDGTIRSMLSGPLMATPPLMSIETDVVIRPASPTTQVNIPISQALPTLTPISPATNGDSIISPAPPVALLSRTTVSSQPIQPPIANRPPTGRGRQPIPINSQPTPIQPAPTTVHSPPTAVHSSPTALHSPPTAVHSPSPVVHSPSSVVHSPSSVVHSPSPVVHSPSPVVHSPSPVVHSPSPVVHSPVVHSPVVHSPPAAVHSPPTPAAVQSPPAPTQIRQPVTAIHQPILVAAGTPSTFSPAVRQPVALSTQPTLARPTNIRSPTQPAGSVLPAVRQPVPLNAQTTMPPGVRQPVPISSTNPTPPTAPTSATPVTAPVQPRPTAQSTGATGNSNGRSIKPEDTQPLPNNPLIHSPAPTLPPPIVPNYSGMSPEEQAQHRANFRTRFGILRGAWPNYHIPDVPDDLPLEQVHAQYDIYVRHIHISRDVDQYKVYLVIMWLLIELFCIKIGLNVGGYTMAQMRSMNKYERLLIELGETNYKSAAADAASVQSNWPVEVRIFFMSLVNAITFIIIKMLASYIGEGMATTIIDGLASYLSGAPPQPGQVLFGGPAQPQAQPGVQGTAPGGNPLPQMGGPFGNIDIASMIGNLGSMFLRGQGPLAGGGGAANAVASTNTGAAQTAHHGPQTPTTPRFLPAYDE